MGKKATIDVSLRITDLKDQLNEILSQLDHVATAGGKSISKAMTGEMTAVQKQVAEIQKTLDQLTFGKVNSKTFEDANKALLSQITDLEKRTSALETGMKGVLDIMSKTEGGKFAGSVKDLTDAMNKACTSAQDFVKEFKEVQEVTSKPVSSGGGLIDEKQLADLQKQKQLLESMQKLLSGKRKAKLDLDYKDQNKTNQEIQKIISTIQLLGNQLDELDDKADPTRVAQLQKNLVTSFKALESVDKKQISGSLSQAIDDAVDLAKESLIEFEGTIDERVKGINNTIDELNKGISKIGTGTGNKKETEEKLQVPLEAKGSPTELAKSASKIIEAAQKYMDKYPLKVPFKLSSEYSSKKTNALLADFQKEINDIEDEATRLDFQDLFNRLSKDFQGKLNIEVTADVKDEAEKVQRVIKSLQDEINQNLRIFPKIEPDKQSLSHLQAILDDMSKSLVLTIGDIALSEQATKKLQAAVEKQQEEKKTKSKSKKKTAETTKPLAEDEAAKIAAIGETVDKVSKSLSSKMESVNKRSLEPIVTSLQQIGQLLVVVSQSAIGIPDIVKDITSNIEEMISVLQKGFGLLSQGELDTVFSNIQKSTGKITGSLRGKNLDAIKDVLSSYQEYKKLGGTREITELSDKKNIQSWLKKHAGDEVLGTEAADIDKVSVAVKDITQKIDEKNDKFKEEGAIVSQVAAEESKALQNVVDVLQQIFENLALINQKGFDAWTVGDWTKALSDALEQISKFEMKSSEGKPLENLKIEIEPLIDPVDFASKVTSALSGVSAEIEVVPSFDPNEFANEISKYCNTDKIKEDILELSDAEAHLAQSGDLGQFEKISQFANKTEDELRECLATEEKWLARCKEGSDAYNKRKANIEEINSLLKGSTETTIKGNEEQESLDKISQSAKEASEAKEKFAEANKEVLSSILESVKGLANESGAFESLNKLIKNLSKEEGMENTVKNLQAIADLLKTEVSDSSILSVLKDIAAQGTNLGDMATLIKASRKEIENAKKAANKAEGKGNKKDEPTIKHNGLRPFLEEGSKDWQFVNQQIEKHKEQLGEVLELYRKVDGELESFTALTTKGNKMIFAKNSEGNWIMSEQRKIDRREEYADSKKYAEGIDKTAEDFEKKYKNAIQSGKQFTDQFNEEIKKAEENLRELLALKEKNQDTPIWDDKDLDRAEELTKAVENTSEQFSKLFTQKTDSTAIDKLLTKIGKDLSDNTKMTPELRNRFLQLRDAVDAFRKGEVDASKVDFKQLTAEFQHLHEEMIRTEQTGKGFFKSIADAAKSQTTQFIARYFSLQDWIRYARQGFENVKSIDNALTELRKVSDASTSRLAQNFETSSKAAQDLGASISGVINITADWARLNEIGLIYGNVYL